MTIYWLTPPAMFPVMDMTRTHCHSYTCHCYKQMWNHCHPHDAHLYVVLVILHDGVTRQLLHVVVMRRPVVTTIPLRVLVVVLQLVQKVLFSHRESYVTLPQVYEQLLLQQFGVTIPIAYAPGPIGTQIAPIAINLSICFIFSPIFAFNYIHRRTTTNKQKPPKSGWRSGSSKNIQKNVPTAFGITLLYNHGPPTF